MHEVFESNGSDINIRNGPKRVHRRHEHQASSGDGQHHGSDTLPAGFNEAWLATFDLVASDGWEKKVGLGKGPHCNRGSALRSGAELSRVFKGLRYVAYLHMLDLLGSVPASMSGK